MTAAEQITGVAKAGRPRTARPVDSEPAPTVCPACLTDQQTGVCPADCPDRKDPNR